MRFYPWYVARFRPRALFFECGTRTVFVNCFIIHSWVPCCDWERAPLLLTIPEELFSANFSRNIAFFSTYRDIIIYMTYIINMDCRYVSKFKVSTSPPTSLRHGRLRHFCRHHHHHHLATSSHVINTSSYIIWKILHHLHHVRRCGHTGYM